MDIVGSIVRRMFVNRMNVVILYSDGEWLIMKCYIVKVNLIS